VLGDVAVEPRGVHLPDRVVRPTPVRILALQRCPGVDRTGRQQERSVPVVAPAHVAAEHGVTVSIQIGDDVLGLHVAGPWPRGSAARG
jgi:hypothetical protein